MDKFGVGLCEGRKNWNPTEHEAEPFTILTLTVQLSHWVCFGAPGLEKRSNLWAGFESRSQPDFESTWGSLGSVGPASTGKSPDAAFTIGVFWSFWIELKGNWFITIVTLRTDRTGEKKCFIYIHIYIFFYLWSRDQLVLFHPLTPLRSHPPSIYHELPGVQDMWRGRHRCGPGSGQRSVHQLWFCSGGQHHRLRSPVCGGQWGRVFCSGTVCVFWW